MDKCAAGQAGLEARVVDNLWISSLRGGWLGRGRAGWGNRNSVGRAWLGLSSAASTSRSGVGGAGRSGWGRCNGRGRGVGMAVALSSVLGWLVGLAVRAGGHGGHGGLSNLAGLG